MILAPRPNERDELRSALEVWRSSKDASAALRALPKRYHVERSALEGLAKYEGTNNMLGALSRIPRQLRSMYLHAFQSLVFNHAASERVRLYGCERAVAGDLVWPHGAPREQAPEHIDAAQLTDGADGEADGGIVGMMAAEADAAANGPDGCVEAPPVIAESGGGHVDMAVHVVTKEEEAAGTYTAHDVLLPLPGYRSKRPENEVRAVYDRVLSEWGVTLTLTLTLTLT